jgi:hypothetical protein
MSVPAAIGAEVVKAIIILLLQEAAKIGMTEEQLIETVKSERTKLLANDPAKIPV